MSTIISFITPIVASVGVATSEGGTMGVVVFAILFSFAVFPPGSLYGVFCLWFFVMGVVGRLHSEV